VEVERRVELNETVVQRLTAEAMPQLMDGFAGTALKLGHDLWVWAAVYPVCYDLLDDAYVALGREPLRPLLAAARSFREHCDRSR
jgi:hypothetical protein